MQLSQGGGGVPVVDLTGEAAVEEAMEAVAEESEEEEINICVAARQQQKRQRPQSRHRDVETGPRGVAGPSALEWAEEALKEQQVAGAAAAGVEADKEVDAEMEAEMEADDGGADEVGNGDCYGEAEAEVASPPSHHASDAPQPPLNSPPPPLLSPLSLPSVGSALRIELAPGEWVGFEVLEVSTFACGEVQHRLRCQVAGLQQDEECGEWMNLSECHWESAGGAMNSGDAAGVGDAEGARGAAAAEAAVGACFRTEELDDAIQPTQPTQPWQTADASRTREGKGGASGGAGGSGLSAVEKPLYCERGRIYEDDD